jgi:hypothetical protein
VAKLIKKFVTATFVTHPQKSCTHLRVAFRSSMGHFSNSFSPKSTDVTEKIVM